MAAEDLYCGQHWAVVRGLPAVARAAGYQADLWVASAGYGLLPAWAQIRSYSATFAASQRDSVWRASDGNRSAAGRAWWNGLQAMPGPVAGAPRSLTALASATVAGIILLIASPAYVTAMADDLAGARAQLTDLQHLIIVSSRSQSLPKWLVSHLVPSEAPLARMLGGSLTSLHARTTRRILQEATTTPVHADILIPRYTRLVSAVEDSSRSVRLKITDEDVRSFILNAIGGDRHLTCAATLRRLRTSGQACEQRRFASLYADVTKSADVS
jgi:hypothetical protein